MTPSGAGKTLAIQKSLGSRQLALGHFSVQWHPSDFWRVTHITRDMASLPDVVSEVCFSCRLLREETEFPPFASDVSITRCLSSVRLPGRQSKHNLPACEKCKALALPQNSRIRETWCWVQQFLAQQVSPVHTGVGSHRCCSLYLRSEEKEPVGLRVGKE